MGFQELAGVLKQVFQPLLATHGRSVQEAATAAGTAFSTLARAMKRTGVAKNRRRGRRTAAGIQAALEAANERAQALAVERKAGHPRPPQEPRCSACIGRQAELEQRGRKEATGFARGAGLGGEEKAVPARVRPCLLPRVQAIRVAAVRQADQKIRSKL